MARFTYIWEFFVAPAAQAQFEWEYGPGGAWVALFRKAPSYIETLLLHDHADSLRYFTIDRWESQDSHDELRSKCAREYDEIDRRCQGLTLRESLIGEFG